jgi:predicted ATPase
VAAQEPTLKERLERILLQESGLTARQLAARAQAEGVRTDKSRVNSVLYGSVAFKGDGSVPPRWSLAAAQPETKRRAPHRLSGISLSNWKVFEDADVPTPGITLLYGENSAGKSSIMQGLLLMMQSWKTGNLTFDGPLVSFGWYEHVVHRHDTTLEIQLEAQWGDPDDGDEVWAIRMVPALDDALMHGPAQPLAQLICLAGSDHLQLVSTDYFDSPGIEEEWADGWIAVTHDTDSLSEHPDSGSVPRDMLIIGSDEAGFPEPDDVRELFSGPRTPVELIRRVMDGASALFASVVHIGPYRSVPDRDVAMSWARDHAVYLARLHDDPSLLEDVNEWLARFEVPYTLAITRYGDEQFALDLERVGVDAERVQLNDVGFGVSQLIPIITQLLGSRERTILIEEPEAHVHPRLQSVLGDLFMTSWQDYGNVIVVETHSEPILLRLQRRVAEGQVDPEDLAVLHVVRRGVASEIEEAAILTNGQLDYHWPGGFFDSRLDDLVAIFDPRSED